MKDTPEFIPQKQFEIIYQKSDYEKLTMTLEMMQLSFDMAYQFIKREYPHLSHRQIIARRFRIMYEKDFSAEELERIAQYLENVK